MEKLSATNEKLLIAQISLLTDDDCNTNMAVEYCSNKLKNPEKYRIKAKKVFIFIIFSKEISIENTSMILYEKRKCS